MSDIAERLRGYNPPDRVDQWPPVCGATLLSIARDIHDGADEIERLRAQVARLTAENDWLRAYTGQSAKACIYCGLGADEQGKCERGFPGCARADDQMLCREVDVAMERDALLARVEAAERDLMDSAMLLRRVSRLLAKADPSALAPRNAMDWLTRRPWFKASPLRDDAAMREGGK